VRGDDDQAAAWGQADRGHVGGDGAAERDEAHAGGGLPAAPAGEEPLFYPMFVVTFFYWVVGFLASGRWE
jgi:hypothetical protein